MRKKDKMAKPNQPKDIKPKTEGEEPAAPKVKNQLMKT